MPHEIAAATSLSTKATKALETLRTRVTKADAIRGAAAHTAAAAKVVAAATDAATANRDAAQAWDALATHAATQAGECRHGAALADRTRRQEPLGSGCRPHLNERDRDRALFDLAPRPTDRATSCVELVGF